MPVTLPPETTRRLQASIKRYCAEHLDIDAGDLKTAMLLDFCLREIGPSIYNAAIADAQAYLHERVSDMDGVCGQQEFTYWAPPASGRGTVERKRGPA